MTRAELFIRLKDLQQQAQAVPEEVAELGVFKVQGNRNFLEMFDLAFENLNASGKISPAFLYAMDEAVCNGDTPDELYKIAFEAREAALQAGTKWE